MDELGSQTDTILAETYSGIPATQHSPGKAFASAFLARTYS